MSETAARPKPLKTINMALTRSTLDTMPEKAQHRLLAYEVNEGQVPPERGVTKKNIDWSYCLFRGLGLKQAVFENSNIPYCRFEQCYLRQSSFTRVDLTGSTFDDCNLRDVEFNDCELWYTTFHKCSLNYDSILQSAPQKWSPRERFLRSLRLNATSMGDVRQADRLLLLEMEADRREQWDIVVTASKWHQNRYTQGDRHRALGRWLLHCVEGAIWGYGVRIHRIALTALAILTGSSFLFWLLSIPLRMADDKPEVEAIHRDLIDCIYVSVMAFTTVGFGDITPSSILGKITTSALGIIGPICLGLFVAAAYRRIQR